MLTIRGQRVLAQADVVVYDDLANAELLDFCPDAARRIYVGKRGGRRSLPQEQITQILVSEALKGLHVVRLKGGDPLVFGRGGEEIAVLAEAGIFYEIVPGVTAAVMEVAGCSMERRAAADYAFNEPLLETLLRRELWAESTVIVVPLFLLPGRHAGARGDIAQICAWARAHAQKQCTVQTAPLAPHPLLMKMLVHRLKNLNCHASDSASA